MFVLIFTMVCVCRRGTVRLGMSKVTQVDFVPKEMVSYSKETQTPTEALTHSDQKAGKMHKCMFFQPFTLAESESNKNLNQICVCR